MVRHPWVRRLVFLMVTCGALAVFELYNQSFRTYHLVSSTLDLGIPLHIRIYNTNRSHLRGLIRTIRSDDPMASLQSQLYTSTDGPSDTQLAAILDRTTEILLEQQATRFSVQYQSFAVVFDSTPDHPDFDLNLDEGNAACGQVQVNQGSVRCVTDGANSRLLMGKKAKDLIEPESGSVILSTDEVRGVL